MKRSNAPGGVLGVVLMAMLTQPVRAAGAAASEREVVANHPAPQLHHLRKPVDELLWRERRQLAVESQHDGVLDARGLDERELFLKRRDRLRAVGGVQDAAWMWLEGDERRRGTVLLGGFDYMTDHIDVTEMYPIEAADRQRHGPDRPRGQSQVDFQRRLLS